MKRYTQKQLRDLMRDGYAEDVTNAKTRLAIPEPYTQIGYAAGIYGCNGLLLQGDDSGTLYVVAKRTTAIFILG